ncbi:hypothetical protein SR39_15580 [Methylobacterium radiotolerans]|nr:hypothetical protein SR39_15580 [Methylobacterium radiotolerans]
MRGAGRPSPRISGRASDIDGVLFAGDDAALRAVNRAVAARDGAILPIQARCPEALAAGDLYDPAGLVEEVTTTINTAAAGGNASLMSVG